MLGTVSKHALRKELRKKLKKLGQDELNKQSHTVLHSLQKILDQLVSPTTGPFRKECAQGTHVGVACYMNMDDSEIKTLDIIKYLFNHNTNEGQKYKVFLPRCTSTKETNQINFRSDEDLKHQDHLTFHHMVSFKSVVELKPVGKYKLREPQVDFGKGIYEMNQDNIKSNNKSDNNHSTTITYKESSDSTSVKVSGIKGKPIDLCTKKNNDSDASTKHIHVTHEKVNDKINLYHPPPKDIQIIIVPGLGFNVQQMSRIGHGKGYYDDYVKRHIHYHQNSNDSGNTNKIVEERPVLIGVCLKEQIVEQQLPLEKHDYLMDYIIDGSGEIYVNEASKAMDESITNI